MSFTKKTICDFVFRFIVGLMFFLIGLHFHNPVYCNTGVTSSFLENFRVQFIGQILPLCGMVAGIGTMLGSVSFLFANKKEV